MSALVLELFSEEIPARMQERAAEDLRTQMEKGLSARGVNCKTVEVEVTPRRLVFLAEGLPLKQEARSEEKRGPRVGAPEQAIEGFLKGNNLTRAQLVEKGEGKERYYFAEINTAGKETATVVKEVVEELLPKFAWPKSMRWGAYEMSWVRPLKNILCVFDGKVVPVQFGHVKANDNSFGHRFLAPDAFKVKAPADYKKTLEKAKVILSREERKAQILKDAQALAEKAGYRLRQDDGLLEEVAGLVEWPVVLAGKIADQFMDLPPEVLTTTMKTHQRYFATEDKKGALAPMFIFVSNMETKDKGAAIISGNQRVLAARLSDARFFWDQDRQAPLADLLPKLETVVFHAKLGTIAEKTVRLEALAKEEVRWVPETDLAVVQRAAKLAKADLVSGMVGEFPELQGIMGRYYALAQSEQAEVADAIAKHYSPKGPNDSCPKAPESVVVALADKMDSLVGLFAAGEIPTGSKDPFALRRAALGIIRLIRENGLRIPLKEFVEKAQAQYPATLFKERTREVVTAEVLEFLAERLKVALKDEGYRHDLIASVFAGGREDDFVRLIKRADALKGLLESEDGANLLTAYRRAANILKAEEKKDSARYDGKVEKALLKQEEEKALVSSLETVGEAVRSKMQNEDFTGAMQALARLRGPVDAFFDKVTVNADDKELRRNRLHMLAEVRAAMDRVAEFGVVEG